jgi:hypothetical protein
MVIFLAKMLIFCSKHNGVGTKINNETKELNKEFFE